MPAKEFGLVIGIGQSRRAFLCRRQPCTFRSDDTDKRLGLARPGEPPRRLISGFANVAVIPFRDRFTSKRLKKPIRRLLEPVFTIGLVAAAFVFLPGLSGKPAKH
jgi:hypothetical protein